MANQWQKRVVIIFANDRDPRLVAQSEALLADPSALKDRDLVVFAVIDGSRIKPIHGATADLDVDRLRELYARSRKSLFEAILVGKDGTVKWRGTEPAMPADLFRLIDSMPMRREELSR
ncbi:DUF4174 domain-containing protein [Microvirga antarctica]|uniref:DUF4174 domain-containing protein n=1 Tax=Microvirga antarctica TaxID=2819233 RepID=UPI001B310C72